MAERGSGDHGLSSGTWMLLVALGSGRREEKRLNGQLAISAHGEGGSFERGVGGAG